MPRRARAGQVRKGINDGSRDTRASLLARRFALGGRRAPHARGLRQRSQHRHIGDQSDYDAHSDRDACADHTDVACSANLGVTWTSATGLNTNQTSPKGFTFSAPIDVFAIADNGSLLASPGSAQFDALPPGATTWAPMSDAPITSATGGLPTYITGPGGGMLWTPGGSVSQPFATAAYP